MERNANQSQPMQANSDSMNFSGKNPVLGELYHPYSKYSASKAQKQTCFLSTNDYNSLQVRDDTGNRSSPPPQLDVADVLRLAKPLERAKETTDCSTITCEEYMYETDRVNGRVNLVRLTILQRPATEEFLGQLYVDRDFREGTAGTVNGAGASCM